MDNYKRKEFIKLSALGFASIALHLNAISSYARSANGHLGNWNADTDLNWDAFLERLTQLAKGQHQLPWDQETYTQQVKQLLVQCNFPEFENVKKELDAYVDKTPNMYEAAGLHHEMDFQVSLFQFEKGEYIPHHDHPDMTGVINVVSGNILAKNYSIEEQLSETRAVIKNGRKDVMQKCIIREVENESIKSGDVSILTAHQGNIHSIMPNEYTQLVDVFTPAYRPDVVTKWYNVNEDGFYQGHENIYEAEYVNKGLSEVQTIELDDTKLARCVGTYGMPNGGFIRVSLSEQQLYFEQLRNLDTPGKKNALLPYEENKYWVEGRDLRCEFGLDQENAAESLTMQMGASIMTINRIDQDRPGNSTNTK